MPLRIFATVEDFDQFTRTTTPSEGRDALEADLLTASRIVERALFGAVFAVGSDGLPSDPTVRGAITEATCAQVVDFEEEGDSSGRSFRGGSLGSLTLPASGGSSAPGNRLAPNARLALEAAGLRVVVWSS